MPSGYVYTWTGKVSTSFSLAGNWYNETLGATATAVPGTSDEALVVASGTIAGPGDVFELGLSGTGSGLSVSGDLVTSYLFVGGAVTVAGGGQLGSGGLIDIGDDSSQTIAQQVPTSLAVSAGATLYSTGAAGTLDVEVGQQGGTGTLSVTGVNATANAGDGGYWVGDNGYGVIVVSAGGQLIGGGTTGDQPGVLGMAIGTGSDNGQVLVTGSGSDALFGDVVAVGFGGTGELTIASGAFLQAGDEQTSLAIGGSDASAAGTVTIDAATATLLGVVEVGADGSGSLTLSDGASVSAVSDASTGTAADWSVLVGAAASGSGTLSVDGGSKLVTSHGIAVGSGSDGVLAVTGGSIVLQQDAGAGLTALAIGLGAQTTGVATVTGGTIYDTQNAGIIVGGYGNGSLAIAADGSQGGVVVTGNPGGIGLTVGSAAGSSGTVSVTGAGSALYVDGTVLDGGIGTGTIGVSAGATFTAGASGSLTGLAIGGSEGDCSLTIGSGAGVSVLGQTSVGASGDGSMTLSGGGQFADLSSGIEALVIGVNSGVSGTVELLGGAGTSMTLVGGFVAGDSGSGTFDVTNGSQLYVGTYAGQASPGILLGANSGSSGTLMLDGGSSINARTGLAVGSNGQGSIDIEQSTLTIATAAGQGLSAISLGLAGGASGTLTVEGGLVKDTDQAGVVVGADGAGIVSISAGGTVITGDPGGASGLAVAVGAGSSGTVSVSGAGSVLDVDGTVSDGIGGTGAMTVTAGAQISAGFAATATALALGGVGGNGTFTLSAGATATVLGQTDVGEYGNGTLTISGGSLFTDQASGFEALVVGSGVGSSGVAVITGAGTAVRLTGGLEAGADGNALVTVENGASLTATTTSGNGFPAVLIAAASGTSTLTVTGAGTRLAATGQVEVGGTLSSGSGNLVISAGATMTVAEAHGQSVAGVTIGGGPKAAASIATVTGAGSAWLIAGQLAIGGDGGAADLVVASGGHVKAGSVLLDTTGAGSLGSISVTGAGSVLSAGGLTIGSRITTGSLSVGAGALVTATGAISLHGEVSLTGGKLSTATTLTVSAHSAITGSGDLAGAAIVDLGQIGVSSGLLTCMGPITGSGSLSISGGGTLQLNRAEAKGIGIDFGAGGGSLTAISSPFLAGTIVGWSAGDFIKLTSQDVTSDRFADGTLTLLGTNNATLGVLHFSGSFSAGDFVLSHPTGSETVIAF